MVQTKLASYTFKHTAWSEIVCSNLCWTTQMKLEKKVIIIIIFLNGGPFVVHVIYRRWSLYGPAPHEPTTRPVMACHIKNYSIVVRSGPHSFDKLCSAFLTPNLVYICLQSGMHFTCPNHTSHGDTDEQIELFFTLVSFTLLEHQNVSTVYLLSFEYYKLNVQQKLHLQVCSRFRISPPHFIHRFAQIYTKPHLSASALFSCGYCLDSFSFLINVLSHHGHTYTKEHKQHSNKSLFTSE